MKRGLLGRLNLVAIAGMCLVGCMSDGSEQFRPIADGFGYVAHHTGFIHRRVWADFRYRDSKGKTALVWPYLTGTLNKVQATNDIAVLIGGKAALYDDGVERLTQRLIAFRAPTGPPLDITDQVIGKWCRESGVEITNVTQDSFVSLTQTNGSLNLGFGILKRGMRGPGSINAVGATLVISWQDVQAIASDVQATGKFKKEKWSGVSYLQKD